MKFCFKYILILVFLLGLLSLSCAQGKNRVIDSLKNILQTQKDDSTRINILNTLSEQLKISGYYDSSLFYAEKGEVLAEKIGLKKGSARALRNIGIIYFHQSNYPRALEYMVKSLILCQQLGNKKGTLAGLTNIGNIYLKEGNSPKALEDYLSGLKIAQEITDSSDISSILSNIGLVYDMQGNYPKALEYELKGLILAQETKNKNAIVNQLRNIGNVYGEQGDYPKALEYELKSVKLAEGMGNKVNKISMAFDLGNIGVVYTKESNYAEALEYEYKALNIARGIGETDEIADLHSNLGEIYTMLKQYKQAKIHLDSALTIIRSTTDKEYTKGIYANLAKLDSATGNYKASYKDYRKYIAYRDSITNQESVMKITQMELNRKFEKIEDSIKAEQVKASFIQATEISRKRVITYIISVVLGLTVLLAIFLINRQQVKRKKDGLLFEREKHRMETELTNAKALLDEYIKTMTEKNSQLEQIKTDFEDFKNEQAPGLDEKRMERLDHLNRTTILTDDDWNKFKQLFEQVHKDFLKRLREKLPDLTQAEVRLVCLTKLELGTKQMAGILGVSLDTIRKSRYRLRKKLGLSEEDSIEDIVSSI